MPAEWRFVPAHKWQKSQILKFRKNNKYNASSDNALHQPKVNIDLRTEAHSAQALKDGEDDDEENIAFALDAKDEYHEDEDESRLTAHDDKLSDDVGEQDLVRHHTYNRNGRNRITLGTCNME